ncbi:hypothetical protein [Streptomyces sp. GF20]|uniref:hypothetical protein n=1 Tax=Streptomyces sp. GF20 TaxID=2692235 RepID=UPI001915F980|nr:hypothetical protein [Streptomyces sp. GF20]
MYRTLSSAVAVSPSISPPHEDPFRPALKLDLDHLEAHPAAEVMAPGFTLVPKPER